MAKDMTIKELDVLLIIVGMIGGSFFLSLGYVLWLIAGIMGDGFFSSLLAMIGIILLVVMGLFVFLLNTIGLYLGVVEILKIKSGFENNG